MILFLFIATGMLLSDSMQLDKHTVDLNSPSLANPSIKVEEQLNVIPEILDIIAKFAMNNDLLNPAKASDYLLSISTVPFKLFHAKELIGKIRIKEFYYLITRTDQFESAILIREPDPVINVIVAKYFEDLKEILKGISGPLGAGEEIYFIITLANKLSDYNYLKDQLRVI